MPHNSERRFVLLAVITMMTWGAAGSFVRLIAVHLQSASPFVALAVLGGRLSLSLIFLTVLLLVFQFRQLLTEIGPALLRRETWIAGSFQFIYYLLAVIAFTLAPISEIALCASTAPIWVLFIRLIRRQPVTRTEIIGAFVALAGVAVIVLPNLLKHLAPGQQDPFPHRLWGSALSLGSAFVTAIYALFQRRYTQSGNSIDARSLSLVAFTLGVPLLIFLKPVPIGVLGEPKMVLLFTGLAFFTTVLPTLAFGLASRRLPPVTTATIALLLPVFATSYAAFALKEMPPVTLVPGGTLVLLGLWFILRPAPVSK